MTHPDGVEYEIWTTQAFRKVAKRWVSAEGTVTLGYDTMGRVQQIEGPTGNVYRFEFDEVGRLLSILTPSTVSSGDVQTVLGLSYNLDGQLLSVDHADGSHAYPTATTRSVE